MRVPGIDLSRAWQGLSPARRERAVCELMGALRAFHATASDELPNDRGLEPPHTLPLQPLLGLLGRTRVAGLDDTLCTKLRSLIEECWPAFEYAPRGLVHGDLHLENVLWDGEHVSALIDLEWSRRSYLAVDLEILLSVCAEPALFVSADYEAEVRAADYAAVPRWLRAAYPQWFSAPGLREQISVLHASRTLGLICDGREQGLAWSELELRVESICGRCSMGRVPCCGSCREVSRQAACDWGALAPKQKNETR